MHFFLILHFTKNAQFHASSICSTPTISSMEFHILLNGRACYCQLAEFCHLCISLLWSINLLEQRNGQHVFQATLCLKIMLILWRLTRLVFQSVEFSKTLDLLVRTSLTKHVSKLSHGIKILQISKFNFSLHVTSAELMLAMDFPHLPI